MSQTKHFVSEEKFKHYLLLGQKEVSIDIYKMYMIKQTLGWKIKVEKSYKILN